MTIEIGLDQLVHVAPVLETAFLEQVLFFRLLG